MLQKLSVSPSCYYNLIPKNQALHVLYFVMIQCHSYAMCMYVIKDHIPMYTIYFKFKKALFFSSLMVQLF